MLFEKGPEERFGLTQAVEACGIEVADAGVPGGVEQTAGLGGVDAGTEEVGLCTDWLSS